MDPYWPAWFRRHLARPRQTLRTPSPGLQQNEVAFWGRLVQPLCLDLVIVGAGYLVVSVGELIWRSLSPWNGMGAIAVGGLGFLGIVLSGFLLDGWAFTRPMASALHMIRRQAAVLFNLWRSGFFRSLTFWMSVIACGRLLVYF